MECAVLLIECSFACFLEASSSIKRGAHVRSEK
jgi:hypothetical protein